MENNSNPLSIQLFGHTIYQPDPPDPIGHHRMPPLVAIPSHNMAHSHRGAPYYRPALPLATPHMVPTIAASHQHVSREDTPLELLITDEDYAEEKTKNNDVEDENDIIDVVTIEEDNSKVILPSCSSTHIQERSNATNSRGCLKYRQKNRYKKNIVTDIFIFTRF